MPKVFLSYAQQDAQAVERVAEELRAHGVELWMDRQNLVAGDEWIPQIEAAISEADFILVFVSRASLNSAWVQQQYRGAFQYQAKTGGTRLIPVLLEQVDLPPFLETLNYVDLSESYVKGIGQILHVLKMPTGPRPEEVIDASKLAKAVAGEVAKILGLEAVQMPEPASHEVNPLLVFVIMAAGSGNSGTTISGNSGTTELIPSSEKLAVSNGEGRDDRHAQASRDPSSKKGPTQPGRGGQAGRRVPPKRRPSGR